MSNWNPRNEWKNLLTETQSRAEVERLDELFGSDKKQDKEKKAEVNKDIGKAEQRTVETWEDLRSLINAITSRDKAEKLAKNACSALRHHFETFEL